MSEQTGQTVWCPECGPGVGVDEDGLCCGCGATAMGAGADAATALLAAVETALEWYDNPGPEKWPETERLQRHAEQFWRETGFMAPGKDVPMAMNMSEEWEAGRRPAWVAWCEKRHAEVIEQFRVAIKLARG